MSQARWFPYSAQPSPNQSFPPLDPWRTFYWLFTRPQSDRSHPHEIMFTEGSYDAATKHMVFTTRKEVPYIDALTHERLEEEPLLFKRCFPFSIKLHQVSFTEEICKMEDKESEAYNGTSFGKYYIDLRGYWHNVLFLNEKKLFELGLITDVEVNTILAGKVPEVFELLTAEVPAVEEFECSICLEKTVEGLVWHPNRCHIFHRECLNAALKEKPYCPKCRGVWFDTCAFNSFGHIDIITFLIKFNTHN